MDGVQAGDASRDDESMATLLRKLAANSKGRADQFRSMTRNLYDVPDSDIGVTGEPREMADAADEAADALIDLAKAVLELKTVAMVRLACCRPNG